MFLTRCLILLACWTLVQSVVAVPDVALEQPALEDRRREERDFGLQERHNHPGLESSLLSVLTEELATTHGPKAETTTVPGGGGGTTAPGGDGGTTVPGGGGGTTVPGGGGGTTVPGGGGGTTVPGGGGGTTVPSGGGGTTVPGGGGE